GVVWRAGWDYGPAFQAFELVGELAAVALPPADAPPAAQQAAVERLAERLDIDLALYDAAGDLVATAGRPLPRPGRRPEAGWVNGRGGPAWSLPLSDGRIIVARPPMQHRHRPILRILMLLAAIALVV